MKAGARQINQRRPDLDCSTALSDSWNKGIPPAHDKITLTLSVYAHQCRAGKATRRSVEFESIAQPSEAGAALSIRRLLSRFTYPEDCSTLVRQALSSIKSREHHTRGRWSRCGDCFPAVEPAIGLRQGHISGHIKGHKKSFR